ncbi:phage/plasmid primase, P4 family [Desulfosporosinus shakirovi]|uniref:phage/plasmid primase, P4 family n=1 Tax=Desulfosporosinus shakirovi TaxID=2885154 RepID=UPI001E4039A2|nr:phage/plasmid primase, P4 family [Desulfosporosinus sp. SRJS8]MCB8817374.1 phage/plasmid primase, P4 family [Desulfosporosinus sp. SRJS8]
MEERSDALRNIHKEYLGDKGNSEFKIKQESVEEVLRQGNEAIRRGLYTRNNYDLTDEEIIEKAKRANRGDIFDMLFSGNWQGYYKSWSEAEISFANMLAFWTAKDSERMDRIYRQSGLKRAKWDEKRASSTYGQGVINDAIARCTKVYDRQMKERKRIDGNSEIQGRRREFEKEENADSRDKESTGSNEQKVTTPNLPAWYQILPNGNLKFLPAVLARYLYENIQVVYSNGQAYKYEKGVYSLAEDIELDVIVKDHLRDDHATMYAIRDVRKQWKIECSRNRVEFDLPSLSYIINLKNGLYDVKQERLLSHTPEHLSLVRLDCSYEPDAKCERFKEFINQALPPESVVLAQEIVGYFLVPITHAQKAVILYGPGRTGKSTFIRVIESIIGENNVSNIAWQDLSDRFRPARLFGKLLNTFADLPDKALKDVGNFKTLIGEDRTTAENKNVNAFEFRNRARFLFSANHLPQNSGDSGESFYSRLTILPFENRIDRDEMDTHLTEKLIEEKDGIFLWAIEGLNRLIKNNFIFIENKYSQKVLAKYKIESSSVRWFVENNCVFEADSVMSAEELFGRYQQSSKSDGIMPIDNRRFIHEMEENYGTTISKGKDGKTRRAIWRGLKLI